MRNRTNDRTNQRLSAQMTERMRDAVYKINLFNFNWYRDEFDSKEIIQFHLWGMRGLMRGKAKLIDKIIFTYYSLTYLTLSLPYLPAKVEIFKILFFSFFLIFLFIFLHWTAFCVFNFYCKSSMGFLFCVSFLFVLFLFLLNNSAVRFVGTKAATPPPIFAHTNPRYFADTPVYWHYQSVQGTGVGSDTGKATALPSRTKHQLQWGWRGRQ